MSPPQLLYLSRADVEHVALDMPTIIELLLTAFGEKGSGRVEMPPKPGIYPRPDSFLHAMPAYISAMRSAGIKWVAAYPENHKLGLPYITGLVVLNDVDTGLPYAVMDCTWITAYRTGAASAVAAKYLARPDSEVVGVLACGVQGRTNLLAMKALFPIERVHAYDVSPAAQQRYVEEMQERLGIEVVGVGEPRKAVVDSDIVITAGPIQKEPTPTIQRDWLKPGAFASAVDFDSYWYPEALAQIDKLVTDDQAQFQYYRSIGYFRGTPRPHADLGEVVAGHAAGRESDDERTMAMNLGLAMDDMAVAPEVYRRARERGIGTWLPL
jgi:ornithine cyclodeaminase/alanine dehydrogenase-like protein (mu-crystallin family)